MFEQGGSDLTGLFEPLSDASGSFGSSGGDFGGDSGQAVTPVSTAPHNSAFVAGFNALVRDPGKFFSTLFGGDASAFTDEEIKTAATKSPAANAAAGLGISPGTLEVLIIGGVVVAGLFAVSLLVIAVRK